MSSKRNILIVTVSTITIVGLITILSEMFSSEKEKRPVTESIYNFQLNLLNGTPIDLSQFKGKYLLIVNTASKCGYTPQYADLQKLHEQYGQKVIVLGFPANNFLWQEPGTNNDIESFCQLNYGVTFRMFEKISVKGSDQHALYNWLEAKSGKSPSWNFCKYLINPVGDVIGFYPSGVNPLDKSIIDQITQ